MKFSTTNVINYINLPIINLLYYDLLGYDFKVN